MLGIETKFAGNDAYIRTVIATGVRDSVSGQKIRYEQQMKSAKETIKSLTDKEEIIERSIRLGTAEDIEVKQKNEMVKKRIEAMAELNTAEKNYASLCSLIDRSSDSKIFVSDTVFPGVVVQLDGQQYVNEDEEKRRVEFRKNENGDLEIHPVMNYG